ncbi:MAG: sensor histidine kinase KdpD [Planctomycetes bacterium]|nr:sensor histidine kinase KdpD [Planctomycetota bacterium]
MGRTLAMLQAANAQLATGEDIVVGDVDVRGHPECGPLLDGLGVLPPSRQGPEPVQRPRFDLEAALARRPGILLLCDLARRNSTGTRHRRRYQDVAELLAVGVSVWTTLDVQQIESLVEIVARITGKPAGDTVPDSIFDEADEVELVDLPPDDLLSRMRAAVPPPEEGRCLDREPMSRSTLVALREIAFRRAADRLNRRFELGGDSGSAGRAWQTTERLLVCVGPSPTSAKVIRTAGRMASSMHAQWIAAYVERPAGLAPDEEQRVGLHLKLAEALGAETTTLVGQDIASELVEYARCKNVSRIVVGKTGRSGWRGWLRLSLVDRLLALSGDIEVYVIPGAVGPMVPDAELPRRKRFSLRRYAGASLAMALATGIAWLFEALGLTDTNMVLAYLLGVAAVAVWYGKGPSIFASFGAVLLFNFFFTEPRYTLMVHDTGYAFTFAVMLVIALLVSTLTVRVRQQSEAARLRERRTEMLYRISQRLSATTGQHQIVEAVEQQIAEILQAEVSILLPDERGELRPAGSRRMGLLGDPFLRSVAQWVYEHRTMGGAGTETHTEAKALCLPLLGPDGAAGVLMIRPADAGQLLMPEQRRLLETFAGQVTLALERDRFSERLHSTLAKAESEKLRSALLSSVSHDFRSPLATIAGASSSLLEAGDGLDTGAQQELLRSIFDDANRLSHLVDNVLHMTRIESGHLRVHREWNIVEDLVGSALTHISRQIKDRPVATRIPEGMPLVSVDGVLIEQVLINLLDNASKYSPAGSPIEISARADGRRVVVAVADRGPGLGAHEKERVFEKFYRGAAGDRRGPRGAGLGLAICQAAAELHGGRIWVEDREGGGASFCLALPLDDQPPPISVEESVSPDDGAPNG